MMRVPLSTAIPEVRVRWVDENSRRYEELFHLESADSDVSVS